MVIVVMGLPGTGKTTLAKALASHLSAIHLSSDRIRKKLRLSGKYDFSHKMWVYHELINQAEQILFNHKTVVLDAGFHFNSQRDLVIAMCEKLNFDPYWIVMTASEQDILARVNKKRPNSEADWEVYNLLKAKYEPLEYKHLALNSSTVSLELMVGEVIEYLAK